MQFPHHVPRSPSIQLGLIANWPQFMLLVIVNAFVGSMVGLERTLLPLLAIHSFGLTSNIAILSFLISFGIVKAFANLFAGRMGDRFGRKRVLVVGWFFGLVAPILIIVAPSWEWVVVANIFLGVNQGLCWSTTVIMKIDLVGPKQRGLAMGLNEAAGYLAVSLAALFAGYLAAAYALRPQPFLLGIAFALCGLFLSLVFVRESKDHALLEAKQVPEPTIVHDASMPSVILQDIAAPSFWTIFVQTSWTNRTLFAISQAGLVNNLNDGLSWGLFPLYFLVAGVDITHIGILVAVYPAVWGIGQLGTGALSDRWGRKGMIATGMYLQAGALFFIVFVHTFWLWLLGVIMLGLGTALVYPTLLAAISDVAHPSWRGSTVGVYRLWRDSGYAIGGLLAGILAEVLGIPWAIGVVAALTLLSGIIVTLQMIETLPTQREVLSQDRERCADVPGDSNDLA